MNKVLIVDDNPFFTTTLAELLDNEGFCVSKANSGEEAIALLNQYDSANNNADSFNLLITDLVMPGMNGFELAQFVRKKNKSSRFMPVIMLTEMEITKEEARKYGCSAYIPKNNLKKVISMAKILLKSKS